MFLIKRHRLEIVARIEACRQDGDRFSPNTNARSVFHCRWCRKAGVFIVNGQPGRILQKGEKTMVKAFSQLKRVLGERGMSVPELKRRLEQQGVSVNLKSLYRLAKDDEPLERLDLRVAGTICQVCDVPLSTLIAFSLAEPGIRRLSEAKQQLLDTLMAGNNEGSLKMAERKQLQGLVREAEEIALSNARNLASQRRLSSSSPASEERS
jgi:hypothetical protein